MVGIIFANASVKNTYILMTLSPLTQTLEAKHFHLNMKKYLVYIEVFLTFTAHIQCLTMCSFKNSKCKNIFQSLVIILLTLICDGPVMTSLIPGLPDIGAGLNNLVSGPLDNIGYIPLAQAVTMCENIARWKVEQEIARIQNSGELDRAAVEIGNDLEARCRGYVEYAGSECVDRLNVMVSQLEAQGRSLLSSETALCSQEVTRVSRLEAAREEQRLTALGQREEQSLRAAYEVHFKMFSIFHLYSFRNREKSSKHKFLQSLNKEETKLGAK